MVERLPDESVAWKMDRKSLPEESVAWKLEWKKFPVYLVYQIVLFLCVPEIAKLDTSLCSKKERRHFLEVLSSKGVLFDRVFDAHVYPNLGALRWLMLRDVSVSDIRYNTASKVPLFSILCMKNEAELARFVYKKCSESTNINRLAVVKYPGWPTKISPLHEAAMNGRLSVVEMLISVGARWVFLFLNRSFP